VLPLSPLGVLQIDNGRFATKPGRVVYELLGVLF
jgi:hypothetical protein